MTQHPNPDELLDDLLHRARPAGAPSPDVRRSHRTELEAAIALAAGRRRSFRRGRWPRAAAAAALIVVTAGTAVAVLGPDGAPRTSVVSGPDSGTSVPAAPAGPAPAELVSAACGGALPFDVPVGDGYPAPVAGPAPGAPGPDIDGQLVAHWAGAVTAVEVRWPADVSQRVLDELGETREDIPAAIERGISASTYADTDLSVHLSDGPDSTATGMERGYSQNPTLDGTYTMTLGRSPQAPRTTLEALESLEWPAPTWGEGMCSIVQLTVRALDGRADVRNEAEALYDALLAPGGPLVPQTEVPPLVVARTETADLAPPTPCRGNPRDPISSEAVAGPGPFPTPDEALAAYLETRVVTMDGPFGPTDHRTAAESGYTAISLPDGRVAYRWPTDSVTGYFYAEEGEGGWTITWTEGPSC